MKTLTQKQTIVMAITLLPAAIAPSLSYADKPSVAVEVVNETNKPVLVRQVDSAALQPFSVSSNLTSHTEFVDYDIYTVPSGKRLVIEYISFNSTLPEGQNVTRTIVLGPGEPHLFLIAIPHFTGVQLGGAHP